MKKAIITSIIAFVVLGIIGIISKSIVKANYKPSIAEMVSRANRDCPIPFAGGAGEVSSITLEDNYLTYHIKFFQENATVKMIEENPEAAKELCYMSFLAINQQQNGRNRMMELLRDNNLGCKVVFTEVDGKSSEITLSQSYLDEISKREDIEPTEALYNGLSLKDAANGLSLPMEIAEGMVLVSSEVEGKYLVMTIKMEEPMYDMNILSSNKAIMKSELMEGVRNPDADMAATLDLCKVSHTGLLYRYIGETSGKKVEVAVTAQDIFNNHRTPQTLKLD